MRNELLGIDEVHTASVNLHSIESVLGKQVPAGILDVSQLGDRLLDIDEVYTIAMNLQTIESTKKSYSNVKVGFLHYLGMAVAVGYTLAAIIYCIFYY